MQGVSRGKGGMGRGEWRGGLLDFDGPKMRLTMEGGGNKGVVVRPISILLLYFMRAQIYP